MNMLRYIVLLLVLAYCSRPAQGQTTWYVDDDCSPPAKGTEVDPFCAIQQAINAASDGDVVLVSPGTYTGDENRDISLFGKTIVLRSSDGPVATIIDIQGGSASIHRGFFLDHGEMQETSVEGFTIINGYLIGDTGGSGPAGGGGGAGIYLGNSDTTIRYCVFVGNTSSTLGNPFVHDGRGGGLYLDRESSSLIEHCVFTGNIAEKQGGGMLHIGGDNTHAMVRNCLFSSNSANKGGGLQTSLGSFEILNVAVVYNFAEVMGGGLSSTNCNALLSNSILWNNQVENAWAQIFVSGPGELMVEFSDVQGGSESVDQCCEPGLAWGSGNIDADPLFVDPENDDFRLLHGSSCIDAGNNLAVPEDVTIDLDGGPRFLDDPDTPDTGNPDPDDPKLPIVDMGPYEYDPDDCNNNDIPDTEDLADGTSDDCNANGIPDDCELDCNANDQQDDCDIADDTSDDCDANGVPDECQADCNENGVADPCDIADGVSNDCDGDGILDECEEDPGPPITQQPADAEVQEGELAFFTVQADGLLLEYQWRKDGMNLVDSERIFGALTAGLLILDVQSTDAGEYDCVITDLIDLDCITSDAATLTVLPPCPIDFDDDGTVGASDLAFLLGAWGPNPNHPADLNDDDIIDASDLALLLGNWGPCE